jgi:hypothetical protein
MRGNAGRMLGRHSVSVRGRGHGDWGDDGRERDSPVPLFDSQTEEADRLYDGLEAGGEAQPCGWMKDRFGASWQIVPDALGRRLRGRDPNRVKRVIRVLLEIKED